MQQDEAVFMPENPETDQIAAAVNEGVDRHKIQETTISEVYQPQRVCSDGTEYKEKPSLQFLSKDPHIFVGMAKRNASLAMVFYSMMTLAHVAVLFTLSLGSYFEWVHPYDFSVIEPLQPSANHVNISFCFAVTEFVLILFDCSGTQNMANWKTGISLPQVPRGIHVATSFNLPMFDAAFELKVPDAITDSHAYLAYCCNAILVARVKDSSPMYKFLCKQEIFGNGIGGYSLVELLDRVNQTFPFITAATTWKEFKDNKYYIQVLGVYLQFLKDALSVSHPYLPLLNDSQRRKHFETMFLQVYGKAGSIKVITQWQLNNVKNPNKNCVYVSPRHFASASGKLISLGFGNHVLTPNKLGVSVHSWHLKANFTNGIYDPSLPETYKFYPYTYAVQPSLRDTRNKQQFVVLPSSATHPNMSIPKPLRVSQPPVFSQVPQAPAFSQVPQTPAFSQVPQPSVFSQVPQLPAFSQVPQSPTFSQALPVSQPLAQFASVLSAAPVTKISVPVELTLQEKQQLEAVVQSGLLQPKKKARPNKIVRKRMKQEKGFYGQDQVAIVKQLVCSIEEQRHVQTKAKVLPKNRNKKAKRE